MKLISFPLFLAVLLLAQSMPTIGAPQQHESASVRAYNTLKNKYHQVAACFKGRTPCSTLDLVILSVAAFALYKTVLFGYKKYRLRDRSKGGSYMYLRKTRGRLL